MASCQRIPWPPPRPVEWCFLPPTTLGESGLPKPIRREVVMNPLIYTRPLRTVVLPEGLARFDPSVHQVVLTDFLMPGLTGLEVAEAIRARGCTTPIVMISGYRETERPTAGRRSTS